MTRKKKQYTRQKKPGFLRKHFKKIAICTSAIFALPALPWILLPPRQDSEIQQVMRNQIKSVNKNQEILIITTSECVSPFENRTLQIVFKIKPETGVLITGTHEEKQRYLSSLGEDFFLYMVAIIDLSTQDKGHDQLSHKITSIVDEHFFRLLKEETGASAEFRVRIDSDRFPNLCPLGIPNDPRDMKIQVPQAFLR